MQLKQSQKEQIRNIINSKLSNSKRGDEISSQVEDKVIDLIERQNFQSKDSLQDKLQGELKDILKENAHHISESVSKVIYSSNYDNSGNSAQKDDDYEQNLYKNKFYSDHSDNSDDEDDDDDDRRDKRKRNFKKRLSIQQSDIQSDNENKSLRSDSEGREGNKRVSRKDSYASNHSGKRDQNKDEKDSHYNSKQNYNQNNGKYQNNKYNNNNSRFKNDKKNLNNNGNNKRLSNGPAAPLPTFMSMNNGGIIPNLLTNNPMMNYPMPNSLNLMQPFSGIFNPRVGPPAPPTGKPVISQAGTGAPSITLSKSKNIIYVFYIPPKLNNVTKISQYFTNKFGAVSAYDKIDETTASIKFEKEESAQKAVDSKEKPFRIEQIVVTFTRSPAPPKPAFVNKGNNQNNNQNGGKSTLHRKPSIDGSEPAKQKFIKNENNNSTTFNNNNNNNNNSNINNQKPKLAINFEQKKKQKQFDEQKRLIQLKFADKLKVMIFIKKREQNPESEIRQEVQKSIDQIKQVKDVLSKVQTQEDLQQVEQHELIVENQYEFAQKIRFLEGKDMSLTELRPKLLEYGKVETLKPHIMEKAVDICFSDFESSEKAYFGLQGQYNIEFIHQHIVKFLKNPFQPQDEAQEEQEEGGNQLDQNIEYQEDEQQGDQIQQDQANENQEQQYQYDENNEEYYENQEQAQEGEEYQENIAEQDEQQQQYQELQDNQQIQEEDQQVDDDL
ncbi:hypothetical protein TTHERM_01050580 (macronuclear) [Tetrahymena thermophila SB210]|uniref:RRM domain-containing protein n=1 Tax=Tetrahymena thermophila (strain SB210) TaxID=312017 RepID=Q22XJ8_TETTS|nr:hypothetical protein TTHERM_01050580 [Tetrahymena thermophila SB210]EAR90012.3 hypothetical protein TTHERM_01050580 [Tetrahymena thermophila SB210]|eukprot:XP_001010257.3 hypothetical protein TTHERM_01050580 [Tetrahymena thermophila SB210]